MHTEKEHQISKEYAPNLEIPSKKLSTSNKNTNDNKNTIKQSLKSKDTKNIIPSVLPKPTPFISTNDSNNTNSDTNSQHPTPSTFTSPSINTTTSNPSPKQLVTPPVPLRAVSPNKSPPKPIDIPHDNKSKPKNTKKKLPSKMKDKINTTPNTKQKSIESNRHSSTEIINEFDLTPTSEEPEPYQLIPKNAIVGRKRRSKKYVFHLYMFLYIFINVQNISYKHRIDEMPQCMCDPENDEFCDHRCSNRVTHEECYEEVCPCPSMCKNMRFQRMQWAKTKVKKAGKKGWGLYAEEDILAGKFVHEYIGELINEKEHKRRMKNEYMGRKKFYVLSTDKKEYIDATAKGNTARFMNHSCDPNLKTEKWSVLGERCIGFFAIRDIKKGEELTFDYNFERYGNDKQLCYCGAKNCRQFLGAKKVKIDEVYKKKGVGKRVGNGKKPKDRIIYRNMDDIKKVSIEVDMLKRICNDINSDDLNKLMEHKDEHYKRCVAKGRLIERMRLRKYIDMFRQNGGNSDDIVNDVYKVISGGEFKDDGDCDGIMDVDVNEAIPPPIILDSFDNYIYKHLIKGIDLSIDDLRKKAKELMNNYKNRKGSQLLEFLYGADCNDAFTTYNWMDNDDNIKSSIVKSENNINNNNNNSNNNNDSNIDSNNNCTSTMVKIENNNDNNNNNNNNNTVSDRIISEIDESKIDNTNKTDVIKVKHETKVKSEEAKEVNENINIVNEVDRDRKLKKKKKHKKKKKKDNIVHETDIKVKTETKVNESIVDSKHTEKNSEADYALALELHKKMNQNMRPKRRSSRHVCIFYFLCGYIQIH